MAELGVSGAKRRYLTAPLTNAMLGGVFIVLGVAIPAAPSLFGTSGSERWLVAAWAVLLGSGCVYKSFAPRIEIDADGIAKYDGLGRLEGRVPWSEAQELSFVHDANSRGTVSALYELKGASGSLKMWDSFSGWDDVKATILIHVPAGEGMIVDRIAVPSVVKTKKQTWLGAAFMSLWLMGFFSIAFFAQESHRLTVKLYRGSKAWTVRYTFENTSKANTLEFGVGPTWLNSVKATHEPEVVHVAKGRFAVVDVAFPTTAAPDGGGSAHLRSWWECHSVHRTYTMKALEQDLRPEPGGLPPIPLDAARKSG